MLGCRDPWVGLALLPALFVACDESQAQSRSPGGSFQGAPLDPNSECPDVVLTLTFRQGKTRAEWTHFSDKTFSYTGGREGGALGFSFTRESCTFMVRVEQIGG